MQRGRSSSREIGGQGAVGWREEVRGGLRASLSGWEVMDLRKRLGRGVLAGGGGGVEASGRKGVWWF